MCCKVSLVLPGPVKLKEIKFSFIKYLFLWKKEPVLSKCHEWLYDDCENLMYQSSNKTKAVAKWEKLVENFK